MVWEHGNQKTDTNIYYNIILFSSANAVDFEGNKVKLPKLKEIRAKLHRDFSGKIKSATVSQVSSGKYYVSILVEAEHEELESANHNVGLDLALKIYVLHRIGKNTKIQKSSGNMRRNCQSCKDSWHIKKREAKITTKQRKK